MYPISNIPNYIHAIYTCLYVHIYVYIYIYIHIYIKISRHRCIEACRDMSMSELFLKKSEINNPTTTYFVLVANFSLLGPFRCWTHSQVKCTKALQTESFCNFIGNP